MPEIVTIPNEYKNLLPDKLITYLELNTAIFTQWEGMAQDYIQDVTQNEFTEYPSWYYAVASGLIQYYSTRKIEYQESDLNKIERAYSNALDILSQYKHNTANETIKSTTGKSFLGSGNGNKSILGW